MCNRFMFYVQSSVYLLFSVGHAYICWCSVVGNTVCEKKVIVIAILEDVFRAKCAISISSVLHMLVATAFVCMTEMLMLKESRGYAL